MASMSQTARQHRNPNQRDTDPEGDYRPNHPWDLAALAILLEYGEMASILVELVERPSLVPIIIVLLAMDVRKSS